MISKSLNRIDKPHFTVTQRSVRERFNLLADKYKTKIRNKENASRFSPDNTALDMLLDEISALEEEIMTQIHAQVSEEKRESAGSVNAKESS